MAQMKTLEDPAFYRAQTVLIVGAMVAAIATLFAPLYSYYLGSEEVIQLSGLRLEASTKWPTPALVKWLSWSVAGATLIVVVTSVFALMSYRSRLKQIRYTRGMAGLSMLVLALVFGITYIMGQAAGNDIGVSSIPEWGLALPLAGAIAVIVAERFIRKDDKKIKSMDRLWK